MDHDDDLGRRFAAGDPEAMREAYDRHGTLVFSLCVTALRHREDAEDAAQQVFTRAWRSRATYDPSRPLGGWLTGITRRVVADVGAARTRQVRTVEAEAGRLPREDAAGDPVSESAVASLVVRQALDRLGPPQDEVLRLAFLKDLPYPHIAERLSLPLGTVKSHVHRGLAALRRSLEVSGV